MTHHSAAVPVTATNRTTGEVVTASSIRELSRLIGVDYALLRVTRNEKRTYAKGWDLKWAF